MSIWTRVQYGKPLSELSTFGVGGRARFFIEITTIADMKALLLYLKTTSIPYFVIGKGSNLLFDDLGFDGLVILNSIHFLRSKNHLFTAGAGYSFSLLGNQTARKGWTGLEFAAGIPGSVGGAVYMNAGANGKETADFLLSVSYISKEGEAIEKKVTKKMFSYRSSPFQKMGEVITSACFSLTKSSSARIDQLDMIQYRMRTQPYGEKSAGCIFRNPEGASAGKLIEQAGLTGWGSRAKVSKKHANFIVNEGKATAQEILDLIAFVRQKVYLQTGKILREEIEFVPYQKLDK